MGRADHRQSTEFKADGGGGLTQTYSGWMD
jgi:hypothetical protein